MHPSALALLIHLCLPHMSAVVRYLVKLVAVEFHAMFFDFTFYMM
jgi:hypothetical protein